MPPREAMESPFLAAFHDRLRAPSTLSGVAVRSDRSGTRGDLAGSIRIRAMISITPVSGRVMVLVTSTSMRGNGEDVKDKLGL
jgi:hypothetical protein